MQRGDEFARVQGGIHCGILQAFIPFYEDENSTESSGLQLMTTDAAGVDEALAASGLKYRTPNVFEHGNEYHKFLSASEFKVLKRHLPQDCNEFHSVLAALLVKFWEAEGFATTGTATAGRSA